MKIRKLKHYNTILWLSLLVFFIIIGILDDLALFDSKDSMLYTMAEIILIIAGIVVGAFIQYKITNKGIDKLDELLESEDMNKLILLLKKKLDEVDKQNNS